MMFFIAMLLATAEPSMQAIVEPAGGAVGFAAVELASGRSLGLKQNELFPMQATYTSDRGARASAARRSLQVMR
jgi:hypothetical protein